MVLADLNPSVASAAAATSVFAGDRASEVDADLEAPTEVEASRPHGAPEAVKTTVNTIVIVAEAAPRALAAEDVQSVLGDSMDLETMSGARTVHPGCAIAVKLPGPREEPVS